MVSHESLIHLFCFGFEELKMKESSFVFKIITVFVLKRNFGCLFINFTSIEEALISNTIPI